MFPLLAQADPLHAKGGRQHPLVTGHPTETGPRQNAAGTVANGTFRRPASSWRVTENSRMERHCLCHLRFRILRMSKTGLRQINLRIALLGHRRIHQKRQDRMIVRRRRDLDLAPFLQHLVERYRILNYPVLLLQNQILVFFREAASFGHKAV